MTVFHYSVLGNFDDIKRSQHRNESHRITHLRGSNFAIVVSHRTIMVYYNFSNWDGRSDFLYNGGTILRHSHFNYFDPVSFVMFYAIKTHATTMYTRYNYQTIVLAKYADGCGKRVAKLTNSVVVSCRIKDHRKNTRTDLFSTKYR